VTTTNPTSGERVSDGRIATIRLAHRQRCFLDGANAELRQHCADIASICDEVIEHRRQSQGAGEIAEPILLRGVAEYLTSIGKPEMSRLVYQAVHALTPFMDKNGTARLPALSHPQPSQGECET
jgi:hypothetical protein